jgi:hypothetical protein
MVHELATDAAKSGALSVRSGYVSVPALGETDMRRVGFAIVSAIERGF